MMTLDGVLEFADRLRQKCRRGGLEQVGKALDDHASQFWTTSYERLAELRSILIEARPIIKRLLPPETKVELDTAIAALNRHLGNEQH